MLLYTLDFKFLVVRTFALANYGLHASAIFPPGSTSSSIAGTSARRPLLQFPYRDGDLVRCANI